MATKKKKKGAARAASARSPAARPAKRPRASSSAPAGRATKTKTSARPAHGRPATAVVDALLRSWPPLHDAHREAFRMVVPDAECDALGAQTKSEAVLREARAWAQTIDRALREMPYELRRYAPPRFVYFLECLRALEQAVLAQSSTGANDGERTLARVHAQARDLHEDLVSALEVVASVRPDAAPRLAAAVVSTPEGLVASLRDLADLADELGRSYDLRTKALVASVALRAEDAYAARAAASAIEAALAAASVATPVTEDLPATNRVEGRVLAEMRFARRMFDRAHAVTPAVPELVPGGATRAALNASAPLFSPTPA